MATSEEHRRDVSHSQFGDYTVINQGNLQRNLHFHLPYRQARAGAVRVIPYLDNDDVVYRQDLIEKLDKLLSSTAGLRSAAL
ncbi:hypothetical protein THARTR1_04677 [Trichoderma harzianum]|uniref:Uncharacterized protein n=1 Tax=Trichoderma harzianum TaxID=5544 RepID=A0A2K0UB25_TRIHA|nr:hypothetical protein THARTR1_04677 [Trichoderma harzianum]